jgi:hypothetical protein
MDALECWFLNFINGIKRSSWWHRANSLLVHNYSPIFSFQTDKMGAWVKDQYFLPVSFWLDGQLL